MPTINIIIKYAKHFLHLKLLIIGFKIVNITNGLNINGNILEKTSEVIAVDIKGIAKGFKNINPIKIINQIIFLSVDSYLLS